MESIFDDCDQSLWMVTSFLVNGGFNDRSVFVSGDQFWLIAINICGGRPVFIDGGLNGRSVFIDGGFNERLDSACGDQLAAEEVFEFCLLDSGQAGEAEQAQAEVLATVLRHRVFFVFGGKSNFVLLHLRGVF